MLPGYPAVGELVRFDPPFLAYSSDSAQAQVAGQTGLIHRVECDSWAWVFFRKSLVLVNTAYLFTDQLDLSAYPRKPRSLRFAGF